MADRQDKTDRKRIQNRQAQRTYRSRMKQRIEDLERQVTTFQSQQANAPAPTASGHAEDGGDRDGDDGDAAVSNGPGVSQVSGRSIAGSQAEARPTTITVKTNMTAPRSRKRTKQTKNDSHGEEASVKKSNGEPSKPEERGESSTAEKRVETPSPSLNAAHPASSLLSRDGQDQISRLQTPSHTPQRQPQDADADAAHAQHSQNSGTLPMPEHLSQGQGQPAMLSSNNSTNGYIHPGLLSPTTQSMNGTPHFAPPYFSPSIPNPAMYQAQFSGYQMVPLNGQGQCSGPGHEWTWPQHMVSHDNRRGAYGQQTLMFDNYGPGSAAGANPPPPAAVVDTYAAANVHANHVMQQPHVSPTEPICVPQPVAEDCEQDRMDIEMDELFGVDLDLDPDTASTSVNKTDADQDAMTNASSPCPSDIVDDMLGEMSLLDAEQTRDLCRILQEVLDAVRYSEADESLNSSNLPHNSSSNSSNSNNNNGESRSIRADAIGFNDRSGIRRQSSLEDRFEFVRLCLAAVGFPSIDAMVEQYYTADFRHDAPVARQQRVSRHTQLPPLLALLRKSTQTWTQWEAHGYQSEIMKSAVALIHEERESLVASRDLFVAARVELDKMAPTSAAVPSASGSTSSSTSGRRPPSGASIPSQALQLLTKSLQNSMPKSWLLTEELESLNNAARQRLYTSLAIVLLLLCSDNRLPTSDVNALAIGCLSIADSSKN